MSLDKDITYIDKTGKVWKLIYSVGDKKYGYLRSENNKFINFRGSVAHLFDFDLENTDEELVEVECPYCERPI